MQCLKPISLKCSLEEQLKYHTSHFTVPCGKCEACIDNKRKEWYIRLKQEMRYSYNAFFVTLTYHNSFMPYNDLGYPTFSKRDVQLFLKRLRKAIDLAQSNIPEFARLRFRYFLVSEYGSQFLRPHYHIIFFNIPDCIDLFKFVLKAWSMGIITCSPCLPEHIGYLANYMYGKSEMPPSEQCDESNKIFMLCSRNPGVGMYYLNPDVKNWHKSNMTNYIQDGDLKYSLPRYFRDKIFDEDEKLYLFIENQKRAKEKRLEEIAQHIEHYQLYGDCTDIPTPAQQEKDEFVRKFKNRCKKHQKNQLNRLVNNKKK